MSRRVRWMVGIAVVVAALAVTIYVTRWRDAPQGGPPGGGRGGGGFGQPVSVRVADARKGSIAVVLDALGTVTARNTVVVRARVDGQLSRINFAEGREVRAGEVLAEIDPRPFDAALQQAEGQLARDEALLSSARSDLDRYTTLLTQDSIAKQQVDDQAALVRQYAGAVQADRGTVASARLQRDFTRITAPIAGRVGLRQVDVGNAVHTSDTNGVVVLTQTRPINVVFAVPADRAPEIDRRWRGGTPLRVEAYDRDGHTLLATGKLESADNVVDPVTSTVKLKAVFDNTDSALFPNQFVNARLTLATLDQQILVPAAAVQHGTPGTFVYLVANDSTVSVRAIGVGVANGDLVAVQKGLQAGDRVVIDGTDKLHEGSKIVAAVDAPAPGTNRPRGGWGGRKPGQTGSNAPAGAGTPDAGATHRRRAEAGGGQ